MVWILLSLWMSVATAEACPKKQKIDPNLYRCGAAEVMGQGPKKSRRVKRPPLTDVAQLTTDDFNAMVRDLRPLVEREAGVKFLQLPSVRMGTKEALQTAMTQDAEIVIHQIYDASEEVKESLIESTIFEDNQGCLSLVNVPKMSPRNKYLALNSIPNT